MLHELIEGLTPDQRRVLRERDITNTLLWRWRHGHSQPTLMQTVDLADVTGVPYHELQAEVTVLRAPEDQRERVARVVGWHGELPRENLGFRAGQRPASTVPSA